MRRQVSWSSFFADSRLKALCLQQGIDTGKGEMVVLVGEVRLGLNVALGRARAECLLGSMQRVERGATAANKRRVKMCAREKGAMMHRTGWWLGYIC